MARICFALGLALVASVAIASVFTQDAKNVPVKANARFCVATYNIHSAGPTTRGEEGAAKLGEYRGERDRVQLFAEAILALDVDLIALEEALSAEFVKKLAARLEWQYAYFPGGWQDAESGWPEGIAAAILTKHPIREQASCPLVNYEERPKDLFTRGFGRVLVEAGEQEIAVFVAHLLPSWKNTTHIRQGEIAEILALGKKDLEAGRSFVVLGDMNHKPDTPEYRSWIEGGMVDVVKEQGGGDILTCPASSPEERIDYVFAAGPITQWKAKGRVLVEAPFGMPAGDASAFALSDHLPVRVEWTLPRAPGSSKGAGKGR